MIFSCQTKDLVSAVMTSIRCLAARTPMEVLEKVYVDADEKVPRTAPWPPLPPCPPP